MTCENGAGATHAGCLVSPLNNGVHHQKRCGRPKTATSQNRSGGRFFCKVCNCNTNCSCDRERKKLHQEIGRFRIETRVMPVQGYPTDSPKSRSNDGTYESAGWAGFGRIYGTTTSTWRVGRVSRPHLLCHPNGQPHITTFHVTSNPRERFRGVGT